jgi:replication initiation protein RepC
MDTDRRMLMCTSRPATGLRKLTPSMLDTVKAAEAYTFTAPLLPGQALSAFKAAAPHLGLRPNVVHAIDWLFRFTDPIDWQPSSRPIVWPSAALQQLELGLGASQVKNLNRHLVELGLVAMRDSPNGKRYGRRDAQGRIIEAYGFDLSPIANRFPEFRAIAQAGKEERARIAALRRRATIARNAIRQLLEAADGQMVGGDEWEGYRIAAATASRGLAGRKSPDEIATTVAALERVQKEMHLCLTTAFTARSDSQPSIVNLSVDSGPMGPENWPHITTTNQLPNPKDTVVAPGNSRILSPTKKRLTNLIDTEAVGGVSPAVEKFKQPPIVSRTSPGSPLRLTPVELIKLAPRLQPYLRDTSPSWPEIVEAADWLRNELGISKSIWGTACLAMGREQAAIAVAIVSTRPPNYFRGSPGAYFHGMVTKAQTGELHLSRTIWGIRTIRPGQDLRNIKNGQRQSTPHG